MAKIYLSDLMLNGGVVARNANAGQEQILTGTIRIPAGTDLATGDVLKFIRVPEAAIVDRCFAMVPDLDDGTALTLDFGYVRPVVDPKLAYNATSNPYTDNAIATADDDFIEEDSTVGQAGGFIDLARAGFTVAQTTAGLAGDADFAVTVATGAGTATTAGGQFKFSLTLRFNDEQVQGEFSGADALDYNTNYDI